MNDATGSPTVAVVPAAGAGRRMGGKVKKQFLSLGGEPVLTHTLRVLQSCPEIDAIILVVPEADRGFCESEIVRRGGFQKVAAIVPGGRDRQDSVYAGLLAAKDSAERVVVHDGVRPFLTPPMVRETCRWAGQNLSAVTGVPVSDTIKSVDAERRVTETMARDRLWAIQTPQAFPYAAILQAHERALRDDFCGTDDAALVERIGLPVQIVMGSRENIKITSPADFIVAEAILNTRRANAGPGVHGDAKRA